MKNTLKNTSRLFGFSALAALIVFSMVGCGSKSSGDITGPGAPILLSISVDDDNAKKEYHVGDVLDPSGLVVTAVYSDNSSVVVDNDTLDISGFDSSEAGEKKLSIVWNKMFAEYTVMVDEAALIGIEITALPNKTEYLTKETLDTGGIEVTAEYTDGCRDAVENGCGFSGFDSSTGGVKTITVTYNDKTAVFDVEVFLTVIFTPGGGNWSGSTASKSETVKIDHIASDPGDPAKRYHSFGGWYKEAALLNKWSFSNKITADTTLYPKWTLNTLTSIEDIEGYLATLTLSGNTAATPVSLPVKIDLGDMRMGDSNWQKLLDVLADNGPDNDEGRYVSLNISECTMDGATFTPYLNKKDGKDKIVSLALPRDVKEIKTESPNAVFKDFNNLETITFGENITGIGDFALNGCDKLALVICRAVNPPALGIMAFGKSRPGLKIKVPGGSIPDIIGVFKGYETIWSQYKDNISPM